MRTSRRTVRFAVTVVVLTILVGAVGQISWRELHQLRGSFAAVATDGFHLSDYIEAPLREMNQALLEHCLQPDEPSRTRFLKEGDRLKEWLRKHDGAGMGLPQEAQLLHQIESALEVYMRNGQKLMEECKRGAGLNRTLLRRAEDLSTPLFELCDELTKTERVAVAEFIRRSHGSLRWLESMLVVSLTLLVAVISALVFSGYHELLVPLRSQLRQSRIAIERHEKLASLGTLAAGVAHEIRNPLTAINVRLHGLKRNLVPGSSEHEDALVIDGEIKRLESIVQAFLQFARPAAPKFAIVAADHLLARVRALLGGQLEKVGIELRLESPPDLWVRVDPQQIEQVLINLVQNAGESIEHNGSIRLRAREGTAPIAGRTGPAVILEVCDTGKGIPPEIQRRLFDPFFTTKEEGTGLGLCIASRIVEQQGGALKYTTQLNQGTTFSIVLPEAKPVREDESST